MKFGDFEITACSDPDYEDLVAEVSYKGSFLLLVNQERGIDNLEVEFPDSVRGAANKVPLNELTGLLDAVRKRLHKLRRES